ncbi:uncharacterized protein JCM6883_004123 [Sporobolomyces salmoneus]|uniref:uncharacterized protein n=1 Tax=Sporobolomyces salmoneus TaxID=183962 RepID=UPI00316E912B
MVKFVTREVEIPEDYEEEGGGDITGAIPSNWGEPPPPPQGQAQAQPPSRRAPSTLSGRSGNSGSSYRGGVDQPPLPALPPELLDSLARNPPPLPVSQRDQVSVTSGSISRTSLSLSRPSNFLGFDSPALPTLPPQSPLDLPYPEEGFSSSRTSATSSPSLSRSSSRHLDAHLPTNPTPSLDASATSNSGNGNGKGRSMFRSLQAFGRSSRSSISPSPTSSNTTSPHHSRPNLVSHPSSDSQSTQYSVSQAQYSTSSPIRLSTVNDDPLVVNSRLPPVSPSLNRRPSRQQLATGTFSHRMSHTAREADRWLFEAQAAGLGIGAVDAIAVAEEEESERASQTEDAEEDDEGEFEWARRGEQYTRDLGRVRDDETDYGDEDGGTLETASLSTQNENENENEAEVVVNSQPALDPSPSIDRLDSPETRFHDAPQSPEAARTPTLPSVPSLPLLDAPLHPNYAPSTPPNPSATFSTLEGDEVPFRRDGKLSLPIYPDTPMAAAPKRRNRSDGDDLNEDEQAELVSRLSGFDLNQPSGIAPTSPNSLADFVVAVVGPRNVGKSSVVKKGLKPRSTERQTVVQEDHVGNRVTTTTTSFTIGGSRRTIEVLEIDMHLLRYNDEGVIWPDGLPQCEGAMLCYDSTDPEALSSLSVLLKAFWTRGSDVPLIVLACKAQPPELGRNATDPTEAAKVCNIYGAGIVTLDGGLEDPTRKTKESFKYIIRQIMENRGEMYRPPSVASNSPAISRRGSVQYATTSRSPFNAGNSSNSGYAEDAQGSIDSYHSPRGSSHGHSDALGLGLSVVQEAPIGAQETPIHPPSKSATEEPLSPKSTAPTYVSDAAPTYESQDSNGQPGSQRSAAAETGEMEQPLIDERRGSTTKQAALDLFFSREDLIDKFLYASVTGNDEAYVTLFLITYRRFARPFDVVEKLIERFEFVAQKLKSDPLLSRFAQMKICGVLSIWMQNYPGDFSAPSTFAILSPFLQSLLPSGATWVAHYALELIPLLSSISTQSDPEASYALPDKDVPDSPRRSPTDPKLELPAGRRPSIAPSYDSSNSQNATNLSIPMSNDGSGSQTSTLLTRTPSDAGTLDTQDSGDQAQMSTTSLKLKGGIGASALIEFSNMIMEMREEEVALQITRLAWEMFGGMTPRDLLRHVLAPRDPANPRVALRDSDTNVMRSIAFVNYLANWTASLILVQGKLKQRARIMEKMLLIALALREQENFDSLMGVLAGLNSQPIFRLSETMELVTNKLDGDPKTQPRRPELVETEANRLPKKLRSLNRLMAATKSFSAYRLALANSGVNMIPYLGVHLQDITVVNEIKSDLKDGKVNWSKFSQMGRSAAIVLDCSRIAPTLPVDKLVERAIVNIPVLDEERQYTLSYQHQPRQSEKPTGSRSRLRTLAKSTFATNSS